jgi:hypothetical protein
MPLETRMPQFHIRRVLTLAVVLVATGSCATMQPPVTNSGPALSSNGVRVSVLRQLCAETSSIDVYDRWINETVELQIQNGSTMPVGIRRDQFRLRAPSGRVFTSSGSPTDPLTIPNGEAQTFEVTFTAHGELDCTKAMQLDPGVAITSQESRVALGPVSFVPLAVR